jgi:hypothetical protein
VKRPWGLGRVLSGRQRAPSPSSACGKSRTTSRSFRSDRTLVEIYFGKTAAKCVTDVLATFDDVAWAARMLMSVGPLPSPVPKEELDRRQGWRLTIWGAREDDLAKRVDAAIAEIEHACRPVLEGR